MDSNPNSPSLPPPARTADRADAAVGAARIPIERLPTGLSINEAVALAYREDLDWLEDRLRGRLSVLIECDKQLATYLVIQLRARLRVERDGRSMQFVIIDGRPRQPAPPDTETPRSMGGADGSGDPGPSTGRPGEASSASGEAIRQPQGVLQSTLANLQQSILRYSARQILCIPHLDLITTTTRSGLTVETRETAAMLYENPNVALLAFKDPSFELPKVIEAVFPFHRSVTGVPRAALPQLVTQAEARKFGLGDFNPYELYKYTSGLNVVRFREVMSHMLTLSDFDPHIPDMLSARFKLLRSLTVTSDFELPDIRFDRDIAGYEPVKSRLREDILDLVRAKDALDDPHEIEAVEKLIPRGIIFEGPPGTGKTLFAKAMATELNATVMVVSGPEIKSMWLGETEANLRRIFASARRAAPSVIVFDEIDSIAPSRDRNLVHESTHSTVNQLLTEMDGFRPDELVFIVGTTNFVASLDQALLRPGRFELKVLVDNPHDLDRAAIIKLYREKLKLDMPDEAVDFLVRKTRGLADRRAGHRFTGDHIYAIMKALKREILRAGKGRAIGVTTSHLDKVLKVWRGEQKSPNPEELKVIAVHEAGHAVLQELLPNHPPTEKITLEGEDEEADGSRFFTKPEEPINSWVQTEAEARDYICSCFGGRVAELAFFPSASAGAAGDFDQATQAARAMVMLYGMSPRPDSGDGADTAAGADGAERLSTSKARVPLIVRSFWRQMDPSRDFPVSDQTLIEIDRAINQILAQEYERAEQIIGANRDLTKGIADRLLAQKELSRKDFADLLPESANKKADEFLARRKALMAEVKTAAPPDNPPAAPTVG